MRKAIKAPESYFTGNIGELSVNLIYQQNHVVCTSLGRSDFGEDLLCDIFSNSEESNINVRTCFSFRTQVKTTIEIEREGYIRKTEKGISVSLSSGLLELWEQNYYPTVLVIWECSKNVGYWCFPTEQINIEEIEKNTVSICVKYNCVFDDEGVQEIKRQVESYYLKMYKTNNAKYKCNIYPVWMPQYRNFTPLEIYNNVLNEKSKNTRAVQSSSDMMPAFLASYYNCNMNGILQGLSI